MVETDQAKGGLKAKLIERMHDPLQLRIALTTTVLLVGYLGIYNPLSDRIHETTVKLSQEQKLLSLGEALDQLRAEHNKYRERLPVKSDSKEYVQYLLTGVRSFPLKMVTLSCGDPVEVGPYRAILMRIEVEGGFPDMDGLIRWVESNKRLMRIDAIRVAPSRSNPEMLTMQLNILGLTS
jgi:Tfp pilus assembly protein PilO